MIGVEEKRVKKRELRHRVKQTPFRRILRAVEDKAAEGALWFSTSPALETAGCVLYTSSC
jgi:putative transposase